MNKKAFFLAVGILAFFIAFIAVDAQAYTRVTSLTTSAGNSSVSGATTNYSFILTPSQTIPSGTRIIINTQLNGPGCAEGITCALQVTGASISGVSTSSSGAYDSDTYNFITSADITTATTITLSNAVNPTASGMYSARFTLQYPMGMGPDDEITSSNPFFLGNLAVVGRITMPDGTTGVSGGGVNVRTQDFSFNTGTGTDSNGYFALPIVTNNGTFTSGTTYFFELWPPQNVSGIVSPDPSSFVYSGAIVTKNASFVIASKTITATVKYNNGNPVVGANVWANKRGGGGGMGGVTNASGAVTLSLSGGSWDVGLNCGWDQVNNRPGSCDWTYNQPPMAVDFAADSSAQTATVSFSVIKATAIIKGKAILPNGSPLPGGFVNIQKDGAGGLGTGINGADGSFQANVPAGDYKVSIQPDNMNPLLAQYYSSEIAVRVGDSESKDLGTITMKQKSSVITGKVVNTSGVGVSGVRINTWLRNGSGWGQATSGADGSFSMYVFAGEWEVRIDNGGQGSNYIPTNNQSIPVTVTDNQSASVGNIEVKIADATLLVKLVDASGNAIPNMFGYAFARVKGAGFGPGNEYGSGIDRSTATIRLLGGVTYTIGMHLPQDSGVGYALKEEQDVAVGVNETLTVKLVLVPNDSVITGYVKDQNGNLVTNLNAEVFANDLATWQWRPTRLQPDGSFSISVRGGKKYVVGVQMPFGAGGSNTSGYVFTHPKPGDEILVPANTTVTKILTLMKADATISGVVQDPNGNPMGRAWVNANNFRSLENKIKADVASAKVIDTGTQTNADGTFSLAVVSGDYDLFAGMPPEFQGNYMPPENVKVTVTAGQPATGVVLKFRQADATLVAIVKLPDGSTPQFGFCHAWSEDNGFSGKEIMSGTSRIPLSAGTWNVGCDSHNPQTNKFYRSDETVVTITKGAELSKSFTMEEGLFEIPKGITETFDATTQKAITLPDGTTITIPSNALATEGNVTFIAEPDINVFRTKDTKPINFAWNFEAMDSNQQLVTTFNSNVTICIPYTQEYLDKIGVDESTIVAKFYNSTSGIWQLPDGVTQDYDSNKVCFSVSHFTNFALATGSRGAGSAQPSYIVATPQSKGGPQVTVYDGNGSRKLSFFAYASTSRFGIQALSGDIDGDGTTEIIVAPGAGAGPQIRIFNTS